MHSNLYENGLELQLNVTIVRVTAGLYFYDSTAVQVVVTSFISGNASLQAPMSVQNLYFHCTHNRNPLAFLHLFKNFYHNILPLSHTKGSQKSSPEYSV